MFILSTGTLNRLCIRRVFVYFYLYFSSLTVSHIYLINFSFLHSIESFFIYDLLKYFTQVLEKFQNAEEVIMSDTPFKKKQSTICLTLSQSHVLCLLDCELI